MVEPIRKTAVAKLVSLLSEITVKNGYTFDVGPRRVFVRDIISENVEVPSLFVVQRIERVTMRSVQRHLDHWLTVNVGFCAAIDETGDPDARCAEFIADIQRAVPYTADISVRVLEDPTVIVQDQISFTQRGNAINVAAPIAGRIFGQCDFELHYTTSHRDPRYL